MAVLDAGGRRQLTTELVNGAVVTINAGSSYQVGDDAESHRSGTQEGAASWR